MIKRDLTPFMMQKAWQAPFFRREINDRFDSFFSGNGYYPNEGKHNTNIRLNLQVNYDSNKRVSFIKYYKVHDLTSGHGKPVIRHADLSARDMAVFAKALSACTVSNAESELDNLLEKASGNKLPDGWKITGIDGKSVEFSKAPDIYLTIPRSRICKAIDISHNYLEILSYRAFWEANRDCLELKDADPLIALFSLVDSSQYYEYEQLLEESNERILQSEIKARCERIKEAAKEGNVREINKQLKLIPQDNLPGKALADVLHIAIEQKNEPLARILVKNGADVNDTLIGVIDNDWESFLEYCLKSSSFRPDACKSRYPVRHALGQQKRGMVYKLLRAGCDYMAFEDVLSDWTADGLRKALAIPNVNIQWLPESLQALKDKNENKLLKMAVANMSKELEHLRGDVVSWLLKNGDLDLMKHYMKQGYPPLTKASQFLMYNTIKPICYTEPWAEFYDEKLFGDVWVWTEFISKSAILARKLEENEIIAFLQKLMKACPYELKLDKETMSILENGI